METTIRPVTEIAAECRKILRREFPECKFSVSSERHKVIYVRLLAAPFVAVNYSWHRDWVDGKEAFIKEPFTGHLPINENHFVGNLTYQSYLDEVNFRFPDDPDITPECWQVFKRAYDILSKDNWDRSDIQTDYFDVHFYYRFEVGKWDRKFEKI